MDRELRLEEAGGDLARLVEQAESEGEITITRDGKPVARLASVQKANAKAEAQEAALKRTLARMEKGWPIGAGPLNRDELYYR